MKPSAFSFRQKTHPAAFSYPRTGDKATVPIERHKLLYWQTLIQQAQDPDRTTDPRLGLRLFLRIQKAISEIDLFIQKIPNEARLHLIVLRLYQFGSDELLSSKRVLRHALMAIRLAPHNPRSWAIAGDALLHRALLMNDREQWRQAIAFLRHALVLNPQLRFHHAKYSAKAVSLADEISHSDQQISQ